MADLPNTNNQEIEKFKAIAGSGDDRPVLMLNLNRYRPEAEYPEGKLYKEYMTILDQLLSEVGGKIKWQTQVHGTLVGTQNIHEAIGIWYPSHEAFLKLLKAPSSEQNMLLRRKAVEHADLHRCEAD
ncbi:hypothetical protein N8Z26_02460 [Burkholderiales bacterium]|nr:hypothetical protein [Burkholderiales bacterium]